MCLFTRKIIDQISQQPGKQGNNSSVLFLKIYLGQLRGKQKQKTTTTKKKPT